MAISVTGTDIKDDAQRQVQIEQAVKPDASLDVSFGPPLRYT